MLTIKIEKADKINKEKWDLVHRKLDGKFDIHLSDLKVVNDLTHVLEPYIKDPTVVWVYDNGSLEGVLVLYKIRDLNKHEQMYNVYEPLGFAGIVGWCPSLPPELLRETLVLLQNQGLNVRLRVDSYKYLSRVDLPRTKNDTIFNIGSSWSTYLESLSRNSRRQVKKLVDMSSNLKVIYTDKYKPEYEVLKDKYIENWKYKYLSVMDNQDWDYYIPGYTTLECVFNASMNNPNCRYMEIWDKNELLAVSAFSVEHTGKKLIIHDQICVRNPDHELPLGDISIALNIKNYVTDYGKVTYYDLGIMDNNTAIQSYKKKFIPSNPKCGSRLLIDSFNKKRIKNIFNTAVPVKLDNVILCENRIYYSYEELAHLIKLTLSHKEVRRYFDTYPHTEGHKGKKGYFNNIDHVIENFSVPIEPLMDLYYSTYKSKPRSALDLGAANGAWLAQLPSYVKTKDGIEKYEYPISRSVEGVDILQGDIEDYDILSKLSKYDLINLNSSMFLVHPDRLFKFIRQNLMSDKSILCLLLDPIIKERTVLEDGSLISNYPKLQDKFITLRSNLSWMREAYRSGLAFLKHSINDYDAGTEMCIAKDMYFNPKPVTIHYLNTGQELPYDHMPFLPYLIDHVEDPIYNPYILTVQGTGYSYLIYEKYINEDPYWVLDCNDPEMDIDLVDLESIRHLVVERGEFGSRSLLVFGYTDNVLPFGFLISNLGGKEYLLSY